MTSDQGEVDMEAFQRLSDTYQPDVQGPLMRARYPIQTLLNEFSNADPTYVTKTAALAVSYSQYRPVKGDGQCGWRAVVFGYFESLLSQNLARMASEKARLQNFNDVLVGVGYALSMAELFVDETLELFDALHQAIQSGDRSDQVLLDAFNDETKSNLIVFHFKLMTSATMKMSPEQYQPYLEQPLQEYCHSNVDAFGQEIEQIGLQALTDGVIAPARINVTVMYLDRSEGGEVTSHPLVANAAPDWPTITLLYRPGHYDMIYKSTLIRAHRVQMGTDQAQFVPTTALDTKAADIQVLSQLNENQSLANQTCLGSYYSASRNVSGHYTHFGSSFISQTSAPEHHTHASADLASRPGVSPQYNFSDLAPSPYESMNEIHEVPNYDINYSYYFDTFTAPSNYFHPPMLVPQWHLSPAGAASSPASSLSPAQPVAEKPELQIRMSQPCYELGQEHHAILPLETNPFKNSPFNRSHFANPDFQPVLWNVKEDYF